MSRSQPYGFGFMDTLLAEVGGVPLDALHTDIDAICQCYDAIVPVAKRLGVDPPRPKLAGFSYCHVSALGAAIVFAAGSEPNAVPIIHRPEDIDELREPADYLTSGIVPERLRALKKLLERRPDSGKSIGHVYEGPITSAALLMGPDFFMLPYDDPDRAHRLLTFCVDSSLKYAAAIRGYFGTPTEPGPVGLPDDFAGMFRPALFAEFVVPYWNRLYDGLQATRRSLHSELLRKEHLHFLTELDIAVFDPSADQYLTTELLSEHCPVPFTARILSWHVRDNSANGLQDLYRHLAKFEPVGIGFHMGSLAQEEKIVALLEVARELAE